MKKYVVKTDFTDKHTKRRHVAGDAYEHDNAQRLKELAEKGIIEEAGEKKEIKHAPEKKHIKKPG